LQAGALVKSGELFALDMGEQVKIIDLARDLIRLSGLEEGVDVDITYSGERKLHLAWSLTETGANGAPEHGNNF
jgi:Polysaccharide biosynthesis protein